MNIPINEQLLDALRKKQLYEARRRLAKRIAIKAVVLTGMQFWFSQLIVWGLSMYHIKSGIWPVWLIMEGVSSMLVGSFSLGMLQSLKDSRDSDNGDL